MKLSLQQYESLYKYISFYCDIPTYEQVLTNGKVKTYKAYLKTIAKQGIKMIVDHGVVKNLKEITLSILKTDSVLIPVNVLEKLIKGDIENE